jgi:hypothetical protein
MWRFYLILRSPLCQEVGAIIFCSIKIKASRYNFSFQAEENMDELTSSQAIKDWISKSPDLISLQRLLDYSIFFCKVINTYIKQPCSLPQPQGIFPLTFLHSSRRLFLLETQLVFNPWQDTSSIAIYFHNNSFMVSLIKNWTKKKKIWENYV